jgi:hypothetical protein
MLADLDLPLTAVFSAVLHRRRHPAHEGEHARPGVADGEVVTLALAQVMMGICHGRAGSM